MALYDARGPGSGRGFELQGVAWGKCAPGATLRGGARPGRECSAQFVRVDRDAAVLDRVYESLTDVELAGWAGLASARPELGRCGETDLVKGRYLVILGAATPDVYVLSAWGLCDQEHPLLQGDWGILGWYDLGGGDWEIYGELQEIGDVVDWADYRVFDVSLLYVYVGAESYMPLTVNGTFLGPGGERFVDCAVEPPPCVLRSP